MRTLTVGQWHSLARHKTQLYLQRIWVVIVLAALSLLAGVINVVVSDLCVVGIVACAVWFMPLYVSIAKTSRLMFVEIESERKAKFHLVDIFTIGRNRNRLSQELIDSILFLKAQCHVNQVVVETPSYIGRDGKCRNHIIKLTVDCMKRAGAKDVQVTTMELNRFSPQRWMLTAYCFFKGRADVNKKVFSVVSGHF
ncbi:hypothetical protein [Vibrio fluvialis]|uniref:hypothetical protein n=1 Tax=Vibrio fluvialis TaxID=676 RepID=UPI00192BF518|nr:hypothetical protein [Vibrio fluvialis]MBL4262805.1 hypothetical protein [Vibrio fluvialis]